MSPKGIFSCFSKVFEIKEDLEMWSALSFRQYQSINNAPDENKRLEQLSWKMFVFFLLSSRWGFYGLKRNKFILMLSIAQKAFAWKSLYDKSTVCRRLARPGLCFSFREVRANTNKTFDKMRSENSIENKLRFSFLLRASSVNIS